MRFHSLIGAVGVLLATSAFVCAEELKSGVDVDGKVGAYRAKKVAGCDDGVKNGKSLCYT